MKKVLVIAGLAISMVISPARAETVQWASYATASSSYGEGSPEDQLLGLAFYLTGPAGGVLSVVGPALGPTENVALCTVFSANPCVPDDPEGFAQDTADGAAEIPDRAPGFLTGLPDAVANTVTGLPGLVEQALFGTNNWGRGQATGAPDTYPSCGDFPTAWAPQSNGSAPEQLTLYYVPAVENAQRIDIYETNIGSFVTSVEITLADGSTQTVFSGPDTTTCAGILSIDLVGDPAVVAVTINTQAPGWEEIDAVGIAS
ncbi:MAG TPA: hypothetical protein VGB64_03670 [Actinomycetota bacterium]